MDTCLISYHRAAASTNEGRYQQSRSSSSALGFKRSHKIWFGHPRDAARGCEMQIKCGNVRSRWCPNAFRSRAELSQRL